MQTEQILPYFKGVRGREGKYMALCPAHEDHNPSLSISAKDGITLIHCFAGCNPKEILDAVGLTFEDLRD